jgi:hypothetical protein
MTLVLLAPAEILTFRLDRVYGERSVNGQQIYFAVTDSRIQTQAPPADLGGFLEMVPAELYLTSDLGKSCTDLGSIPAGIGFGVYGVAGKTLFFTTSLNPLGSNDMLWETDGTRAGTHVISQFNPGGYISSLDVIGNYLLVNVEGALTSYNFNSFQSQQISDPNSVTSGVVLYGGYGYFTLNGDLARTDGTIQGTVDLYTGAGAGSALPLLTNGILPVGNALLLFSGSEIYVCAGSVNTIAPVAPLPAGKFSSVVAFDGQALFLENDSLWRSDGTSAGTGMIFSSVDPGNGLEAFGSEPYVGQLVATPSNLFYFTPDAATSPGIEAPAIGHLLPGQVYLLANLPTSDSSLELQVATVSFSNNVIGSTVRGSMRLVVSNSGGTAATALETLAVYFANDSAGDGLTLVKSLRFNLRLKAGSSRSISVPLNQLPNLPPGEYSILAQVIESGAVLAQSSSVAPVVLVEGAALSNLSYMTLPNRSVIIRFEIVDIANVPLSGTYEASVSYADSTTSEAVIGNPRIKLLARPKHPQHVQFRVPSAKVGTVSIKTGGLLAVDVAGVYAQTGIPT